MAYRAADNARWEQLDFILGIHIQPSESHPQPDICDMLAGDYPKTFKFSGWHPQCFCIMTPILPKDEELVAMADARAEGEEYTPETPPVTEYPKGFKDFVQDNADNIRQARLRGTEPYFLRDNRDEVNKALRYADKIKIGDEETTVWNMMQQCRVIETERGKVYLHPSHGINEQAENIMLASWRANNFGEEVILLPNPQGVKSADTFNITRGVMEEYKCCTAPTRNSLAQQIRSAKDQADYVIVELHPDMSHTEALRAIKGRITDSTNPPRCPNLKVLRLKIGEHEAVYTREQIIANGFKIRPEDFHMGTAFRNEGSSLSSSEAGSISTAKLSKFFNTTKSAPKKSALEIAAERHAARTPEEIADIQTAWNTRQLTNLVNLSDRIGSYRDTEMVEWSRLLQDEIDLKEFAMFQKDYKLAKAYLNGRITSETAAARAFMQTAANKDNMAEFAQALGIMQGELMTFFEADMLRGNPNYAADVMYRVNCQTCVVAYELRRRGFNIQALGNFSGSKSEVLSMCTNGIWQTADGKVPSKTRIGAEFNHWRSIDPSGKVHKAGWQKTVANRKQLVSELETNLTEDGRYHIDWTWKGGGKTRSGHIITVEKIGDTIRYYDPQNGKVISDFGDYIKGIDLSRGINLLRVDNLRIKPDYAAEILAKSGTGASSGAAATGGVTGRVTPGIIKLRNEALSSNQFRLSEEKIDLPNLSTSKLYLNNKPLERIINHCISQEEIDAVKYMWNHPDKLHSPRVSPLGEGKDMTTEKAKKNIAKKKKRGVTEYIEYELEYNGSTWLIKLERHRAGFEQPYHIRKKK